MEQLHVQLKQQPGERGHLHRAEAFSPRLAGCPPWFEDQAIRHAGTSLAVPWQGWPHILLGSSVTITTVALAGSLSRHSGCQVGPCSLERFHWPTGSN